MAEVEYQRGMQVRREVLGERHVERAEAAATDFDREFQRFLTETAWGNAWAREGIDRKTRHLICLSLLAALGREHELEMHVRATANTGVAPEELREALFQVAIYAGIPAANRAFSIAKQVYADEAEHE